MHLRSAALEGPNRWGAAVLTLFLATRRLLARPVNLVYLLALCQKRNLRPLWD
jgi:hypothetical protein